MQERAGLKEEFSPLGLKHLVSLSVNWNLNYSVSEPIDGELPKYYSSGVLFNLLIVGCT